VDTEGQTSTVGDEIFSEDLKKCRICGTPVPNPVPFLCCEAEQLVESFRKGLRACDRAFLDGTSEALHPRKARDRHLSGPMHAAAVKALAEVKAATEP